MKGARITSASVSGMPSMTPPHSWTVAQHFAIWIGLFAVLIGLVGLALNPDFSVGDDATAESFIGLDWNGWHGVAAILVGVPGLAMAWYTWLAIPYLVFRATADAAVGLWAAVDDRPLGVLFLPTSGDAVWHLAIAAVVTLGIVLGIRRSGRAVEAT